MMRDSRHNSRSKTLLTVPTLGMDMYFQSFPSFLEETLARSAKLHPSRSLHPQDDFGGARGRPMQAAPITTVGSLSPDLWNRQIASITRKISAGHWNESIQSSNYKGKNHTHRRRYLCIDLRQ